VEDDKTSQVCENDASNGISMNEEEHKLEFVLLLLVRFSSTKQKFLLKICYLKGNGFKNAMNSLNVGRIKLAAACLDAQRRVTSGAINLCK
jgi:alkylation response protein AidB-like acyl-CoA dehydrogenase